MWFRLKRDVAPLYKDETQRRLFATASGRPRGVEKLKKLELADSTEETGWRRWLTAAWKRRPN